ncbi:uncharacterized protein TNCV_3366141 [Trichonephila clavipes]|nr:uncharacterized protein TNCV_3366141 [Trichonephila clavipes]
MRIIDSYNLVLQDLHRKYPTATNTHTKGYIKIEAQTENDHNEIINYLKDKNLEFYVIEPPLSRPLKLVIKGLPVDIDPEDIKNDLISKGIKIVKTIQLKRFITKTPLPIYMIEIARDENVNDIFQIRSCLYMQIKIDPFKKGNRITQCNNCNFFHHATSNCNMKTRCLKCGENHRTANVPSFPSLEKGNCKTRYSHLKFHDRRLEADRDLGAPIKFVVNDLIFPGMGWRNASRSISQRHSVSTSPVTADCRCPLLISGNEIKEVAGTDRLGFYLIMKSSNGF